MHSLHWLANIVKVVHVRDNTELAGFEYERDGKNRITEVREYRGGQLKATTTYAYGDGNLSSNDLDASTNVDPTKLYWSWLGSTFTAARQGLATPGRPIPLADDSRLG